MSFGTGNSTTTVAPPSASDGDIKPGMAPTWNALPANQELCSEIYFDDEAVVPRERQCAMAPAVRMLIQLYEWLGMRDDDDSLMNIRGGIFTYRDVCLDHFLEHDVDEALLAGAL